MATLTTHNIKTLIEFVTIIKELGDGCAEPHWYRGVSKSDYKLLPSLYRHPTKKEPDELKKLEMELLIRFKERSFPYLNTSNDRSDWEYLFLMQHFGVPTRLLDWTENSLVALFFALSKTELDSNGEFLDDVAVWILCPGKWNRTALYNLGYKGSIISSLSDNLATDVFHLRRNPDEARYRYPIAMFGIHNSPRIVAQRGVFTLFGGQDTKSMEDAFSSNEPFPDDALRKIHIPAKEGPIIFKSLLSLGYTDTMLFPDLDGLAREIKRYFNF